MSKPGYVWDGSKWVSFVGPKGDVGAPLNWLGTVTNMSALPPSGSAGDAYVTADTGFIWVWEDYGAATGWQNRGPFTGPKGDPGESLVIKGVVTDQTALPNSPANLDVYMAQSTSRLYIYDPVSPAAGKPGPDDALGNQAPACPAGWVDLGAIAGPEGPQGPIGPAGNTPFFAPPVATWNDLPSHGRAGESIIVEETGRLFSWDPQSHTWEDAGQVMGASGHPAVLYPEVQSVTDLPHPGPDGALVVVKDTGHLWGWDSAMQKWNDGGKFKSVPDGVDDMDILTWDAILGEWVTDADYLGNETNVIMSTDMTVTDGGTFHYHAANNEFVVRKMTFSDLGGVDVAASTPGMGDVLGFDGTNWVPKKPASVTDTGELRAFLGTAPFDPTKINTTADNFGMDADTIPDPKTHHPKVGDIYINRTDDDVVFFEGVSASYATQAALLNAVRTTLGAGWDVTAHNDVAGHHINIVQNPAPQPMMLKIVLDPTDNIVWPATSRPVTITDDADPTCTFTYQQSETGWNIHGGDWSTRQQAISDFESQFPTSSLAQRWACVPADLGADWSWDVALVPLFDPRTVHANWGVATPWASITGASSAVPINDGKLRTMERPQDVVSPLVTRTNFHVTAPLTDYMEQGRYVIHVPMDTVFHGATLNLTLNGTPVSVTVEHGLSYFKEDRENAHAGDVLEFDGDKWLPKKPAALPDIYTKSEIDLKVAALTSGLEHMEPVLAMQTDPPASPIEGDAYIVNGVGTGQWVGHDKQVATYTGGQWVFVVPKSGEAHLNEDDMFTYTFNGTSWVKVGGTSTKQSASSIGSISYFPFTSVPAGWLVCDGSTFNGATYPELQAALGGTTLPDLRDKFIRSWDGTKTVKSDHNDTTRKPRATTGIFAREEGNHHHVMDYTIYRNYGAGDGSKAVNEMGTDAAAGGWGGEAAHYTPTRNDGAHWHNIDFRGGWDTETAPKHIILVAAICALEMGARGPAGPRGAKGERGDKGDKGEAGETLKVQGVKANVSDLPTTNVPALDVIMVQSNGHLYVYDPASNAASTGGAGNPPAGWVDLGQVQGPPGADGAPGTMEIRNITALPAGSTPTIRNVSTSQHHAVLDIGMPPGPKGDTGPAGQAAVISVGTVSATTGNAPPTVTNVGTTQNAILNFELQKGEKGDKGDKGDPGVVTIWKGTQTEYDAIATKDVNTIYLISGN